MKASIALTISALAGNALAAPQHVKKQSVEQYWAVSDFELYIIQHTDDSV
jgi:hypothetical protein